MGGGGLDLWYGYDWWNGTFFNSQFVSSIVDIILVKKRKEKKLEKKKKKKKKKERKWWRKLFLMYKLSMFIIPPKIPRKGFVYTWYIQRWKLLNGVIGFTCLIYLSLSWFIFASLVSMAFELHFQIFPTLILKPHYNP